MDLDLSQVPVESQQRIKQQVADLLIDSTLEYVSRGESPVAGEGAWKQLSKDYADSEKGGDRTPNMELSGEMLDDFSSTISPLGQDWVEVGISGGESEAKAESHNHFSGQGSNPRRRFIPDGSQTYKSDIMREVSRLTSSVSRQRSAQGSSSPETTIRESISFDLSSSDFVGQDSLSQAIGRILSGS